MKLLNSYKKKLKANLELNKNVKQLKIIQKNQ